MPPCLTRASSLGGDMAKTVQADPGSKIPVILKQLFCHNVVYFAVGATVVLWFLCGLSIFTAFLVLLSHLVLIVVRPMCSYKINVYDIKNAKEWGAGCGPLKDQIPANCRGLYYLHGNVAPNSEFDFKTGKLVKGSHSPLVTMDLTWASSFDPETRTIVGSGNSRCGMWNHLADNSSGEGVKPLGAMCNGAPGAMPVTRMKYVIKFDETYRTMSLTLQLGALAVAGEGGLAGVFLATDDDGTGKRWTRKSYGSKADMDNKNYKHEEYYMLRVVDEHGNIDTDVLDKKVKMWGDSKVVSTGPVTEF